ncbi:uncharacterized protein LOC107047251 isoform X2 [Diachasma alloeum]|uniref:uncharacterized protein LOC107041880 isoform X2 n=1 Tax=Diachasma alloeum TaxID=454923 RepID=UPI00073821F5|nr:uncharacterized protein LOC107041880 isoform X2 [Diachasma alloeum]XP_015125489.1 uncharacterized protein LOC107047251 isoform X2 [Diachasma alloeum]
MKRVLEKFAVARKESSHVSFTRYSTCRLTFLYFLGNFFDNSVAVEGKMMADPQKNLKTQILHEYTSNETLPLEGIPRTMSHNCCFWIDLVKIRMLMMNCKKKRRKSFQILNVKLIIKGYKQDASTCITIMEVDPGNVNWV